MLVFKVMFRRPNEATFKSVLKNNEKTVCSYVEPLSFIKGGLTSCNLAIRVLMKYFF